MRKIVLPRPTRIYRRIGNSNRLYRTSVMLPEHEVMTIGDEQVLFFNKADQRAVPFLDNLGKTYYLLVKELGLPVLTQ